MLEISGTWAAVNSTAPLQAGQAVAGGVQLRAVSNHPGNAITVVNDDDLSRQHIVCDATAANPCLVPLVVHATPADTESSLSRMAGMVRASFSILFDKSPVTEKHYAITMSRGVPPEKEQEAVLLLSAEGSIALPDAPAGTPVGAYTLRIMQPGSEAAQTLAATLRAGRRWDAVPLSAAGLYEVSVRDAEDHPTVNVLLLAVDAGHFDAAHRAFEQVRANTQTWSGPGARTDEHLFLRSFLAAQSLAAQSPATPSPVAPSPAR